MTPSPFPKKLLATATLLAALLAGCGGSDNTPPELALILPDNLQGDEPVVSQVRFTLTGTATDDEKVAAVQLRLNDAAPIDVPLSEHNFTVPLVLRAGANEYTITAKDTAGNETSQTGKIYLGHRVAAGNAHSGVLLQNNLYTWGRNNFGQTGLGFTSTPKGDPEQHPITPTQVTLPAQFVALAFNGNFSLAIDEHGQVWSWGDDSHGELGRGDADRANCGTNKTNNCRLDIGAVPGLDNVVAIAAGYDHALALKADGSLWSMGWNSRGQLGNGNTEDSSTPVQVQWLPQDASTVGQIVQIAAGSQSSFALDDKGQVWAWGTNRYGNAGRGETSTDPQPHPTRVPLPENVVITAIASGKDHVLARATDGTVYAWGLNASSQVGYYLKEDELAGHTNWPTPILTPTLLPWTAQHPVTEVYANGNASYVRDAAGRLYQWGMYGITNGNGKTSYPNLREPTHIQDTLSGIRDFVMGQLHNVAIRDDGALLSWGWSFEGSLGGGENVSNTWMYNTPVVLSLPQ